MASPDLEFTIGGIDPPRSKEFNEFLTRVDQECSKSLPQILGDRANLRAEVRDRYGSVLDHCCLLHDGAAEAVNWAAVEITSSLEETPEDEALVVPLSVV